MRQNRPARAMPHGDDAYQFRAHHLIPPVPVVASGRRRVGMRLRCIHRHLTPNGGAGLRGAGECRTRKRAISHKIGDWARGPPRPVVASRPVGSGYSRGGVRGGGSTGWLIGTVPVSSARSVATQEDLPARLRCAPCARAVRDGPLPRASTFVFQSSSIRTFSSAIRPFRSVLSSSIRPFTSALNSSIRLFRSGLEFVHPPAQVGLELVPSVRSGRT